MGDCWDRSAGFRGVGARSQPRQRGVLRRVQHDHPRVPGVCAGHVSAAAHAPVLLAWLHFWPSAEHNHVARWSQVLARRVWKLGAGKASANGVHVVCPTMSHEFLLAQNTTGLATLPVGDEYLRLVQEFRSLNPQYASSIGFVNGELRYVSIDVVTSLEAFLPNFMTQPVYEVRTVVHCSGWYRCHRFVFLLRRRWKSSLTNETGWLHSRWGLRNRAPGCGHGCARRLAWYVCSLPRLLPLLLAMSGAHTPTYVCVYTGGGHVDGLATMWASGVLGVVWCDEQHRPCTVRHTARCTLLCVATHIARCAGAGTPCSASLESCRRCWAPGTSTSGGRWESRSPSVLSFASGTQRHAVHARRHQLTLWWPHSFSVDYVVHLGHMYSECVHADRDSRVRHAAVTMGVTVVAGAATTLGAGLVMLLCQLTFFTKVHAVAAIFL